MHRIGDEEQTLHPHAHEPIRRCGVSTLKSNFVCACVLASVFKCFCMFARMSMCAFL